MSGFLGSGGAGVVPSHYIGGTSHRLDTLSNLNSRLLDYTLGVSFINSYFVGKHGNDSNTGKTVDQAFLTFGAAILAASSGDTIICLDSGTYTEHVIVPAGINVYAPNANLVSPGGGIITNGALEMNDGVCVFNTVTSAGGESAVVKVNTSGTARFHGQQIILPGSGGDSLGILNISTSQNGVLLAKVDSILVGPDCFGVGSITQQNGHTHIEAEDIYLNGNNAIAIANAFISSTTVARVSHILKMGAFTGTVGINCGAGRIDAVVLSLEADNALNAGNNTIISITCDNITGTKTNVGSGVIREATFTQTVP